jgi:hypothetical protein
MSCLPRRPIFRPIRSRLMVNGLSAITCDLSRNPFSGPGSMVTRKFGASASSEVNWQTTTEAWFSGKASVCTMTAGRGLPWSPAAATVTRSPRRICVERGDRFDPFQRVALAIQIEAGDLLRRRTAGERESATTRRNSRRPRARRRRIIFILLAGAAIGFSIRNG